jgi:hypothetical protein
MNALPDGDVAQLPARKGNPPVRHLLGDPIMIPPHLSPSGFEQKEKTCKNCGAVRILILDPKQASFRRAWRRTAGGPQIETDNPPPCDKDAGWPA